MIPASFTLITLSVLLEIGGFLALYFFAADRLGASPFTSALSFGILLAALAVAHAAQRLALGYTWAQWLAGMKPRALRPSAWLQRLREPLFLRSGQEKLFAASFLTAVSWVFCIFAFQGFVLDHPAWRKTRVERLETFFTSSTDWSVLPFFYSLGTWPRIFRAEPVFHTLPYEKGPPSHFVGHIIARWESPDTRVIFEGPKTPGPRDRAGLRACFLKLNYGCAGLRELVLTRHLEEMNERVGGARWDISWFEIANPAIPKADEPQGVRIIGVGANRGQERFVFITPGGTHQAIMLDFPIGAAGDGAREVFLQAIRSTRVTDDLTQGRSWINSQLQAIRLDEIRALDTSLASLARLAEVQALLLSKISVEPKTFDAFFHLGGTSLMIAKFSKKLGAAESNVGAAPLLQTIQSTHRYSIDVSSQDPRTTQLEGMVIEAKKYF